MRATDTYDKCPLFAELFAVSNIFLQLTTARLQHFAPGILDERNLWGMASAFV